MISVVIPAYNEAKAPSRNARVAATWKQRIAKSLIDGVPVDYCACALVELLAQNASPYARYYISAGPQASCSFEEIDSAIARATGTAPRGELQEFDIADLPALEPGFERWFGPCETKRAAHAIRAYCAFAGLNVTFDNSRLRDAGMAAPTPVTQYIDACVTRLPRCRSRSRWNRCPLTSAAATSFSIMR